MKLRALVLLACIPLNAHAYTGVNLPCEAVGQIARAIVIGKNHGKSYAAAMRLARQHEREHPSDSAVIQQLVKQIYKADFARHLSPDGAYHAYEADCEVSQ